MAHNFSARSGRDVYASVLETIRRSGYRRESRNGLTYALDDTTIHLESPADALPLGCRPKLSRAIAAAEALQLIGAFSDPPWLVALAPQFSRYLEPDGRAWGAYGLRIGRQGAAVVRKLQADPYTRQAVVTLWNPDLDNEPGKLDYPCTVALGFSRQTGRYDIDHLNMNVVMRSNDAWLGLPYDMFQFAQLQLSLCNVLDLLPGRYTHTAWNMHLYETDREASYEVTEPQDNSYTEPGGIGDVGDSFEHVSETAYKIAMKHRFRDHELTQGEEWFYAAIHGTS